MLMLDRRFYKQGITMKDSIRTTNDAAQVLAVFNDIAEKGTDELIDYAQHCGITLDILATAGNDGIAPIILGHYRVKPGLYDLDRVSADLLQWPPIAQRIVKLERRKNARKSKVQAHR